MLNADHFRKGKEPRIFLSRNLAIDILKGGIRLYLGHGGVLIHYADQYVIAKGVMEITQDTLRFAYLAGKEEVAHDHATHHKARGVIKDRITDLTVHFIQREGGLLEIVRTVGKSGSGSTGSVFEIGKIDIDQTIQHTERFDLLIATGIIDNGQGETLLFCYGKCKPDLRCVMRGRDQIYVVSALFLEFHKDLGESFRADGLALVSESDFAVLTVDATQITAGKEDGT